MKPNRYEAKVLAETVTDADLEIMFSTAIRNIKDWTVRSSLNLGMTKGAAFNMLKTVTTKHNKIGVKNAIREFGEFLPESVLKTIVRQEKPNYPQPYHEDPIFD